MQQKSVKAHKAVTSFKPEVTLVETDEYQIAYGYSELVGEHCIGEKWSTDLLWFSSHPKLTRAKLLSLIAANMDGTNYDNLMDLGAILGILLIKTDGIMVHDESGMDVYVKHQPLTGEPMDPKSKPN